MIGINNKSGVTPEVPANEWKQNTPPPPPLLTKLIFIHLWALPVVVTLH